MNKVLELGFLNQKKPVELKLTTNGKAVATYSISVPRDYQKDKEKKEYDYFSCVQWGAGGEWLANNSNKVKKVLVEGRLETRHYEAKDGTTKYVTEIVVSNCEVTEWAKEENANNTSSNNQGFGNDMTPIDDGSDIPF